MLSCLFSFPALEVYSTVNSMTLAIEIKNLTKRFRLRRSLTESLCHPFKQGKEVLALDSINLTVNKGEIVALLGPNGAGKTTLIKILCSLVLPDEGQVTVLGFDLRDFEDLVKSKIGLLTGEERSLYCRLTGRQNLEFFGALYGLSKKDVCRKTDELNEILEIDDLDKPFENYSSGMKIRIGIARCLLNDPEIIFLDEPTRSLDPVGAEKLRIFLRTKLADEMGKTVFLTTHHTQEATTLADRVAIINHGKMMIVGTLDDIRTTLGLNKTTSLNEIYHRTIERGES